MHPSSNYFGQYIFQRQAITRYQYLEPRTLGEAWTRRQKTLAKLPADRHPLRQEPRPVNFDEPHPSCLLGLYNDPSSTIKWAPRDSLEHPCATLAEWRTHGYDAYDMLLSIIGVKADDRTMLASNKFVRIGWSYFHLSFDRFVSLLQTLRPADRIFCFVIPTGAPVHMYFDIDGDFDHFPNLIDQDEACLNAFLNEVRSLFRELFGRDMDCTGLTLLQATSQTKLSWHLHVQTEAFRDVRNMKQFVVLLNQRVAARKESPSMLISAGGKYLVDEVPYMSQQNFRAPYCSKPGKTALLPRTIDRVAFTESGRIRLEAPKRAVDLHANVDAELLWRCHPALAQPGPGYTYLELASPEKKRKRKAVDEALTTSNRARKLAGVLDAASASKRSTDKTPKGAIPESVRPLTDEEDAIAIAALRPILGREVELDTSRWYRTKSEAAVVSGVCTAGTALCIAQSKVHNRNRMAFSLHASGDIHVRCFKCDVGKVSHSFLWEMSKEAQVLLEVEPVDSPPAPRVEPVVSAAPVADPPLTRTNRLIEYIRSKSRVGTFGPVRLAPVFTRRIDEVLAVGHPAERLLERRMRDKFQQTVFSSGARSKWDAGVLTIDRDDLYERVFKFYEQMQAESEAAPPEWCKVMRVCERYLDPTQPAVSEFFDQHRDVVLQSGQNSNKTGVVLVILLIKLLMKSKLRVAIYANRKTYASSVKERADEFDRDVSSAFGVKLGFRSYTEEEFRMPSRKSFDSDDDGEADYERAKNEANRRLVSTPRIIISEQSQSRLFAAKDDFGEPMVPEYDVIFSDEFHELMAILHGATMDEKRRLAVEHRTILMTRAKCNIVADADIKDHSALPLLHALTGGRPFAKLLNTAKTIQRKYVMYKSHAQWRQTLVGKVDLGLKVFVACNTKAEVQSIVGDPALLEMCETKGIQIKGLHADSPADDRKRYIESVRHWVELDLMAFSPTISHGVNMDQPHFDVAFLYASDNSTKACQTFQQLNRARQITSNEVHVFINAHPKRFEHLPCDYDTLKAELNQEVRHTHGDWFTKKIRSASLPVAHVGSAPGVADEKDPEVRRYRTCSYILETRIDPVTSVRQLFDSVGNELYLRNQVEINRSCVDFENLLVKQFQLAGGTISRVQPREADQPSLSLQAKQIKEADTERKKAALLAILAAGDVTTVDKLEEMRWRHQNHRLDDDEIRQMKKAEWKVLYGIDLQDVWRLQSVEDFCTRFGDERRMDQARRLKKMRQQPKQVVVTERSDPIPYQTKEKYFREHIDLVLQSVGFTSILDDGKVLTNEQHARLEPGQAWRIEIVARLQKEQLSRKGWWVGLLKSKRWRVRDDGELVTAGDDGVPVEASVLFQKLLTRCRQFLSSTFGMKVANKQVRRGGAAPQRTYEYRLDRTHWNEFSTALLGMPPQVLEIRAGSKRRRSSGGSLLDSSAEESSAAMDVDLDVSSSSELGAAMEVDESMVSESDVADDESAPPSLVGLNETQRELVRRLWHNARIGRVDEADGRWSIAEVRELIEAFRK